MQQAADIQPHKCETAAWYWGDVECECPYHADVIGIVATYPGEHFPPGTGEYLIPNYDNPLPRSRRT